MSDLFKKLNTLVRAGLHDVFGGDADSLRRRVPASRLGGDIDREIGGLRQRINDALSYEDKLRAQIQRLTEEVRSWDVQADAAVQRGDDVQSRYAIMQMQLAQQRLTNTENDLRDHQVAVQELIERVNVLESVVADARHAQGQAPVAQPPAAVETLPQPSVVEAPAATKPSAEQVGPIPQNKMLSDILREAREKINAMGDLITAQEQAADQVPDVTLPPSAADQAAEIAADKKVDDDLAARRARLSKPE